MDTSGRRIGEVMDTTNLSQVQNKKPNKEGFKASRYYDGDVVVGKDCTICQVPKKLSEFPKVAPRYNKDGHSGRCTDCTKAEQQTFREKYRGDPTKDTSKYGRERAKRTDEEIESLWPTLYPEGTKKCTKCSEVKPLKKFNRKRSTPDGINHQCATCTNRARRVKGDPKEVQARKYPDGTKTCPKCQTEKTLDQFHKNRATHDGLHRNCRSCDSTNKRNKRRQAYESHWKANNIPFECYICQGPYEQSDHVYPESLGGSDEPHNRLPICAHHNGSKNGTPLETWLATKHPELLYDVMKRVTEQYNTWPYAPTDTQGH